MSWPPEDEPWGRAMRKVQAAGYRVQMGGDYSVTPDMRVFWIDEVRVEIRARTFDELAEEAEKWLAGQRRSSDDVTDEAGTK